MGKRFAVAKLTASLSARTKLRPRLLVATDDIKSALFRHPRSKSAPASIDSSRPAWKQATCCLSHSPATWKGEPSLFGSSSAQCGTLPFFCSIHWVYLVHRLTPWQQEKAILCYTPVISCLPRHANSHRVPDHIP